MSTPPVRRVSSRPRVPTSVVLASLASARTVRKAPLLHARTSGRRVASVLAAAAPYDPLSTPTVPSAPASNVNSDNTNNSTPSMTTPTVTTSSTTTTKPVVGGTFPGSGGTVLMMPPAPLPRSLSAGASVPRALHFQPPADDDHDGGGDSPSEPDSPAAVAGGASCDLSIGDLVALGSMCVAAGICLSCNRQVGLHRTSASALTGAGAAIPVVTQHRYTELSKAAAQLVPYKWTKQSVCHTTLQSVKHVLRSNNVDPKEWTQALILIMDHQLYSQQWIETNIINAGVTWSEACRLFTSHFELAGNLVTVRREFNQLKHQQGESVQMYVDSFTDYMLQLGDPDTATVRDKFMQGLQPWLFKQYVEQITNLVFVDPDFSVETLDEMYSMVIKLDVADRTIRASTKAQNPSGSTDKKLVRSTPGGGSPSKKKGIGKSKHCANHPNSASHDTRDCLMGRKDNGNKKYSATPPGGASGASGTSSTPGTPRVFTCYECRNTGHKKGDPSCPLYKSNTPKTPVKTPSTPASSQPKAHVLEVGGPEAVCGNSRVEVSTFAFVPPVIPAVAFESFIEDSESRATVVEEKQIPVCETKLFFNGQLYRVVWDCGADISVVSLSFVEKNSLKNSLQPVNGPPTVKGVDGIAKPRLGLTPPLAVVLLFDGRRPPVDFTYQFDVIDRGTTNGDEVLLGRDLIHRVFPRGIPEEY